MCVRVKRGKGKGGDSGRWLGGSEVFAKTGSKRIEICEEKGSCRESPRKEGKEQAYWGDETTKSGWYYLAAHLVVFIEKTIKKVQFSHQFWRNSVRKMQGIWGDVHDRNASMEEHRIVFPLKASDTFDRPVGGKPCMVKKRGRMVQ